MVYEEFYGWNLWMGIAFLAGGPPGGHFLGGEEREKVDEILVYEEFYGWNL